MNKKDVAAALAGKTGLSQVKATEVLNALFNAEGSEGIISAALAGGDKVLIAGFGTFSVRERAPRVGTNPSSGEKIEIAAKKYAHFKPGKTLAEVVE